jgi:hypothetical protein
LEANVTIREDRFRNIWIRGKMCYSGLKEFYFCYDEDRSVYFKLSKEERLENIRMRLLEHLPDGFILDVDTIEFGNLTWSKL